MYLAEVEGKGGINVKLVAYSVSPEGGKIATFELTYHRYIHGEFMTHRLFSRNAMSSRAVPVNRMLDVIEQSPAYPIHWGKNQPGMQADEELQGEEFIAAWKEWAKACDSAVNHARELNAIGAHKQIVNRIVEPYQMMKTVMTATELDNFFWLRLDKDAQPEIFEMARCIRECLLQTEPELLQPGEWHTPYVSHHRSISIEQEGTREETLCYYVPGSESLFISKEEALAISSSCCAQVSYRNLDNTYEKAMGIYSRLLSGAKVHASPFEHQATPMLFNTLMKHYAMSDDPAQWEKGITHVDRRGNFWSGNFMGWVQHRQLLDNHNCTDYQPD